ncbi:MAG TPA: TolC family protein [Smithella sp.]|nr:TolC family protein [Smithella sp.]HRS96638.1 TolC family protein [Smithella sp.]
MKRYVVYLMLALAGVLSVAAPSIAQEYTLEEIYQRALKHSEKIDMVRENIYLAQMNKDKALSLLIPRVTAYGTYNLFSEDKYASSGILIQPEQTGNWGIRADQNFSLSLRELDALKIADQSVAKSEYELNAAQADFILAVASAYYDVLKAQKTQGIAVANLERLSQYHRFVEKRVKVGELTRTALLRAEGELSGARADYLKAGNALQLARAALIRLTDIEDDFQLKEEKPYLSDVCLVDDLRKTAYEARPDLKGYEIQISMASRQVQYSRGAFWPSMGLFAVYNRADQDPPGATLNRESVFGGVSLTFPLFEGGLRLAEFREAKARERQAKLAYEDLRKNIDVELRAGCLDLATMKGSLKFLEDQLVFARDNYNAVLKQFENGLATSLDVMDANTLLLTAEKNVAEALYNYQLASLKVRKSSGTLLRMVLPHP